MRKTLTALVTSVVLLVSFGVVLVASASSTRADLKYDGDVHFFFKRQLIWLAFGALAGLIAARFDYHWWQKIKAAWIILLTGSLLVLIAVLIPGIGRASHGSSRWLVIGPLNLQPSEFAKLSIAILASVWMSSLGSRVRTFLKGFLFPGAVLSVFMVLLLAEPDFGATMVVAVIGGSIIFVAGARLVYIILAISGMVPGILLLMLHDPIRRERIRVFVEGLCGEDFTLKLFGAPPENATAAGAAVARAGYQLNESIQAFISGGPFGVGLNNSMQKQYYLPEAHTDFIFAIAGEEFGLIATLCVTLLYVIILVCGVLIAMRAPDKLGRLIAFGMTILLVFQAAFNIGVVTGCLPTKGIALPFISYGGTNLVVALMAIGVLVNVGRHAELEGDDFHTNPIRDAVRNV